MADYLVEYAERFDLAVRLSTRVLAAEPDGGRFAITTSRGRWRARNLVVATGAHRLPATPAFADRLDPGLTQVHSGSYRRPSQLPTGDVLVVGAGNSGAEIALDVATDPVAPRRVHLAGRDVGRIPDLGSWTFPLMQRFGRVGATVAQRRLGGRGEPLGRIRPDQLLAAWVRREPRVIGVRGGLPLLEDERTLSPTTVIWCTGLRPDYSWLTPDVLDSSGRLRHRGGVVDGCPGLFAVGLPYQRSITSHLLGGVGADARVIAARCAARDGAR